MKHIKEFIIEGLRINKDIKIKNVDILETILNVIKPLQKEKVEKYLKKWIEQENIKDVHIYLRTNDYFNMFKKYDESLIKRYDAVDSNNNKAINRIAFNKIRDNWKFIGKNEGLGYWENYFGYSVSGSKRLFTSTVYIVGIEDN